MGRIQTTFDALKAQGRKALIPYVTAGFPFADITPALMHGMVEAGADVIIAGRACDDSTIAAYPIWKGGDLGLAIHMGKILECGAFSAEPFAMDFAFHDEARRKKAVIMVSRFGHCLNDLLYRWRIGALPIDITARNMKTVEALAALAAKAEVK